MSRNHMPITRRSIAVFIALAIGGVMPSFAYPPPRIPKEQIPQDAPPQVRDLIEKLYSRSDVEAAQAATALGELGETASPAAPFLASMMHTKHIRGPAEAKNALKKIGKAAVEPAALALQLGDHYARRNAADVLQTLRDPRAIDPLITCYDDTSDRHVGEALRAIGQPALDRLLEYAEDKDANVRARAVKTLSLFSQDSRATAAMTKAIGDSAPEVRLVAITAQVVPPDKRNTRLVSTSAPKTVIDALEDKNALVRRQAAVLLGQIGDAGALPALAKHINDADPAFRRGVIQAVGSIKDARATDLLLQLLTDKDAATRATAATLLNGRRDDRIIPALKAAAADKQPEVRERALISLAATRSEDALDILVNGIKDSDALVRKTAVEGVASYGAAASDRAQTALEGALSDADDVVRIQALNALATFGKKTNHVILAAAGNDAAGVRRAALNVLYTTRENALLEKRADVYIKALDDADESVRQEVLELTQSSRGVIELPADKLRPLLEDKNWRIKNLAIRLLAQQKDPAALPAVVAMLSNEEASRGAFEMLPLFGTAAIDPLTKAATAESAWLRRNAVSALARIDDPLASAVVRKALTDSDAEVRQIAARAFERHNTEPQTPETLVQIVKTRAEWSRDAEILAGAINKDPSKLGVLKPLIESPDENIRNVAAALLGQTRIVAAIPALKELSADKSDGVRITAIEAMRHVRDAASTSLLINIAEKSEDLATQETALRSLATLAAPTGQSTPGDEKARTALVSALGSSQPTLRAIAVELIGRLRSSDAPQLVTAALKDEHYDVRRAAATAIADLQDRTLAPQLIPLLSDKHWYVRAEAYTSLRRITGQQQIPAEAAAWQDYFEKQNAKNPKKK